MTRLTDSEKTEIIIKRLSQLPYASVSELCHAIGVKSYRHGGSYRGVIRILNNMAKDGLVGKIDFPQTKKATLKIDFLRQINW